MVKLVVAVFPDLSELFQPGIDFFHLVDFDLIEDLPAFLVRGDEFTFIQYLNVFGDGGARDVEVVRNGASGHRVRCQQHQDRAACRVGNCLEWISSEFHASLAFVNCVAI